VDWRQYTNIYIKSQKVYECPSDTGAPSFFSADPTFGGPMDRDPSLGGYGSSYCINVVMARLGTLNAVVEPADTYLGAEIYPWHNSNALVDLTTHSGAPSRMAYYCDGHAKVASELDIYNQCTAPGAPAAPGIGSVP